MYHYFCYFYGNECQIQCLLTQPVDGKCALIRNHIHEQYNDCPIICFTHVANLLLILYNYNSFYMCMNTSNRFASRKSEIIVQDNDSVKQRCVRSYPSCPHPDRAYVTHSISQPRNSSLVQQLCLQRLAKEGAQSLLSRHQYQYNEMCSVIYQVFSKALLQTHVQNLFQ